MKKPAKDLQVSIAAKPTKGFGLGAFGSRFMGKLRPRKRATPTCSRERQQVGFPALDKA